MKPELTKSESQDLTTRILEKLGVGHKNAMLLRDLTKRLGIPERKTRMGIEQLRREGWCVLISGSKPFGYFMAESQTELDDYCHYMKSRMIEEYHTYKIVRKATIRQFHKSVQLPLIP